LGQQLLSLVLEANNLVTVILYGTIFFMSTSAVMNFYNRKHKEYHDRIRDDELQATAIIQIGLALIFGYVAILRASPDFAVNNAFKVFPLQVITVGIGSAFVLIGIILSKKVARLRERIAYEEKLAEEKKVLEAQKKATEYLRKTMTG